MKDIVLNNIINILKEYNSEYSNKIDSLIDRYHCAGKKSIEEIFTNDCISFRFNVAFSESNSLLTELDSFLSSMNVKSKFWFMRKNNNGNHLRVRIFLDDIFIDKEFIVKLLNVNFQKNKESLLKDYKLITYEPEKFLFGGDKGLTLAHDMFCLDSNIFINVILKSKNNQLGSYELSIWLLQYIAKKLGFDSFELWDYWKKVFSLRKSKDDRLEVTYQNNKNAIKQLVNLSDDNILECYSEKKDMMKREIENVEKWCIQVKSEYINGNISVGLREYLATITLFVWNRWNIKAGVQSGTAYMLSRLTEPFSEDDNEQSK